MSTTAEKRRNCLLAVLLGFLCCAGVGPLHAAVVVFSNDTPQPVTFVVGDSSKDQASHKAYKIVPGDVLPVPVAGEKTVWFDAKQNEPADSGSKNIQDTKDTPVPDIQSTVVEPNSIYAFIGESPLMLKHEFSAATVAPSSNQSQTDPANQTSRTKKSEIDAVVTIPIMILVDDDEPRKREIWEPDLTERIKQASDIFEQTCRIRFEIAKIGTWETDDQVTDFDHTFNEFQKKVKPDPGIALAIGFTSQYEVQTEGRFHMGGTKGPLYPYILIREWSQHVGKPERLELVVHELGHVFGATHTPDQSSVMRQVVGDNRSNAKSFRIGFDPLNTLAAYLFCEPIRLDGVRSLQQYSPEARAGLVSVYGELGRRFPTDNSAAIYQATLRQSRQIGFRHQESQDRQEKLLVEAARLVVRTIVLRASQLETSDPDRRFQECVQRAAQAVEKLPPELAARAMMLGIGISLDPSGKFREQPGFQATYDQIVSPPERQGNRASIGPLSIRGHADWAERFAATLGKSVLITPNGAEASAVTEWWKSAEDQKPLDLRDVAIDIAAATFASRLLSGQIPIATLVERFDVDRYLPDEAFFNTLAPSPDHPSLDLKSLELLYGGPNDPRFLKFKASVRRLVVSQSCR